MARITCAISGLRFETSFLGSISITHTSGYYHPIFALSQKGLYQLYTAHCRNQLTPTDSYLLFLAFLHSSNKVTWEYPATLNPNDAATKKLVQNNIAQLVRVLEKSAIIKHPSFKQPSFKVTIATSNLAQIANWIKAWEDNIKFFHNTRATIRAKQDLLAIENKLTLLIRSGERTERYSHIVADWAAEAGDFPQHKRELWKHTIRSCFNTTKMFNTSEKLLLEIKDYCECNIEAGSIHFHELCTVLKEGIARHHNYLGGSALATGFTIIPNLGTGSELEDRKLTEKCKAKVDMLVLNAPTEPPKAADYPDSLSFLKAKIAYRIAATKATKENEGSNNL